MSVLLVDSMNLFVRHFCANPSQSSTSGEYVGGTIGYVGMLASIIRELSPSKVIAIWEAGGSKRRRQIYPEYKQGRKPPKTNRYYNEEDNEIPDSEENKQYQIQLIIDILNNLPIAQVYVPDCEADDIIGYFCKNRYKDDGKIILSSDKDFYQLVDDKTKIYTPTKKLIINENDVLKEYNIHPNNFCVAKAFCGDSSDNINGIERVGFKTLAKRFEVLGSSDKVTIDDIVQEAEVRRQVKKPLKIYTNICEGVDIVRRNWKLMYLDMSMLSTSQIDSVCGILDDFKPQYNKLKIHQIRRNHGLLQLDIDRICNSVSYLVHNNNKW